METICSICVTVANSLKFGCYTQKELIHKHLQQAILYLFKKFVHVFVRIFIKAQRLKKLNFLLCFLEIAVICQNFTVEDLIA
jgi:hypothetical protein